MFFFFSFFSVALAVYNVYVLSFYDELETIHILSKNMITI